MINIRLPVVEYEEIVVVGQTHSRKTHCRFYVKSNQLKKQRYEEAARIQQTFERIVPPPEPTPDIYDTMRSTMITETLPQSPEPLFTSSMTSPPTIQLDLEAQGFEHISLTIWRRRGRQSHLGGPYERVRGAR